MRDMDDLVISLCFMVGQYCSEDRPIGCSWGGLVKRKVGRFIIRDAMQASEHAERELNYHGILNDKGMFVVDWWDEEAIKNHLRTFGFPDE